MRILVVCTANQCRSPMAEALLRARLAARGVGDVVTVASAGLMAGGAPATDHARAVVRGLDGHVSRPLSPAVLDGVDLVVGMTRAHVREVVVSGVPLGRAFTLKELVRRGIAAGVRRDGESVDDWLHRVGAGRTTADLMGEAADDDVADPIGKPRAAYEATAAELDRLLATFTDLVWPASPAATLGG